MIMISCVEDWGQKEQDVFRRRILDRYRAPAMTVDLACTSNVVVVYSGKVVMKMNGGGSGNDGGDDHGGKMHGLLSSWLD